VFKIQRAVQAIGIIGSVLLIVAWFPSTIRVWREKKSDMPLAYSLLLCAGVALILAYSFFLKDVIFIVLNLAVLLIGLYNIWFIPRKMQEVGEWFHEVEEIFGRRNKYYVVRKRRLGERQRK